MLREKIAKQILETSKLSGEFQLRTGVTSNTYFDKYLFEAEPTLLRSIAELLAGRLPVETEVLAGLEMGGIPVATLLSQVTGLPAAFVRKQAKSYGTAKYAEGVSLSGKRVTIIEDVVSSGGAIIDAVTKLRADNIEPIAALCVIDRESGGREALDLAGVKLLSLFTLGEIDQVEFSTQDFP